MSEWRDIETTPKDGSPIFLWGALESSPFARPRIGSEERYEAYWAGDCWNSVHYDGYIVAPRFWMPLPADPEVAA